MNYEERDGRAFVPVRLEPYGAVFVIFREPAATAAATAARDGQPLFLTGSARDFSGAEQVPGREGQPVLQTGAPGRYELTDSRGRTARLTVAPLPDPVALAEGWTLDAPLHELDSSVTQPLPLVSLKSWTDFDDARLKYFSGTLEYTREIDLDAARLGDGLHLWLDLGEVHELAEVVLNGQNLGILWKPPWRVELTGAARPGKNKLAVRVTNFWPNRIIGAQFLPEARRVTQTNVRKLTRGTPLMVSGLRSR